MTTSKTSLPLDHSQSTPSSTLHTPTVITSNPFIIHPHSTQADPNHSLTDPTRLRVQEFVESIATHRVRTSDVASLVLEIIKTYELPFKLIHKSNDGTSYGEGSARRKTNKLEKAKELIANSEVFKERSYKAGAMLTKKFPVMVVGSVADSMLDRLTIHNPYLLDAVMALPEGSVKTPEQLRCAAMVYVLIKTAVLVHINHGVRDNGPLMETIKIQSPALHDLLRADHHTYIRTYYPWLNTLYTRKDEVPDDLQVQDVMYQLQNQREFAVLGHALDMYLQHTARTPLTVDTRPQIILNPDLLQRTVDVFTHKKTRIRSTTAPLRYLPHLYTRDVTSDMPMTTCQLSRALLSLAFDRHDMYYTWTGEWDKRYFTDYKGQVTRGSVCKWFGWMSTYVDKMIDNSQGGCDLNPYTIKKLALEALDEVRPYTRVNDHSSMEDKVRLTSEYDYLLGDWAYKVADIEFGG